MNNRGPCHEPRILGMRSSPTCVLSFLDKKLLLLFFTVVARVRGLEDGKASCNSLADASVLGYFWEFVCVCVCASSVLHLLNKGCRFRRQPRQMSRVRPIFGVSGFVGRNGGVLSYVLVWRRNIGLGNVDGFEIKKKHLFINRLSKGVGWWCFFRFIKLRGVI